MSTRSGRLVDAADYIIQIGVAINKKGLSIDIFAGVVIVYTLQHKKYSNNLPFQCYWFISKSFYV